MLVSFIVVALNAGDKLNVLLKDLQRQDYVHCKIEVILVDSHSRDNTKEVMRGFAASNHDFSRVVVLDNPKKTLPCGWNIALKESRGDVILRVDAHSSIPKDFVRKNVEALENGENIVGGHRISVIDDDSPWQRTLLIAETSVFGSGIATYRRSKQKKHVKTLAHAAYRRKVFQSVGGYDERLARTEDNEIHYRMRKAGFRFLLDPSIKSFHHARNKLPKMLKQKFMNGKWIGLTLGVAPKCFSVYHLVPFFFILALIACFTLHLLGISAPMMTLLLVYFITNVLNTAIAVRGNRRHFSYVLLLLFSFASCCIWYGHFIWSIGIAFWLRKHPKPFTDIFSLGGS